LKRELEQQLERFGQTHLLRFWDELDESQAAELSAQIQNINFELIQSLVRNRAAEDHWDALAARAEVPPAITLADFADQHSFGEADALGRKALEAGKVGMILVAGGQGSRLGFEHPKGMFPIGPISNRSLYQIHFEQVLARSRQFGATIPLYVMTSPPTHDETTRFLTDNHFFGLGKENVRIFCQGVMPAVDLDGRLLLEEKGKIFVSPDGHGGTLSALIQSGCLDDAMGRGVEHLFYGQVDNPLIQICNPALVGYHLKSGSEMTSQVVRKTDPLQKVGNVVEVDGKVQIIEYSDLPEEYARQTNPDGSLKLWAGSIAVHIFSIDFLRRSSTRAETLPFHLANKQVPFINEVGEPVQPETPNAIKFERFIFDLLPFAQNAIVCEVDPADGFCAVKNAPPAASETPQHVKDAISALHTRWLTEAGVIVEPGIPVEISPLFAPDQPSLAQKMAPGTRITEPTFFQ
jgi:UDP-N-acetylglucosamine/UDP-N-acetylgalactosamine diphosphorylase